MRKNSFGFSLLELMIIVIVIGVLAGTALPIYNDYATRARLSELVMRLTSMGDILYIYAQENGDYPNDTHIIPPPEVNMPDYWSDETAIGGNFNWEGPNNYPYAGISILGATAPLSEIRQFDKLIDNGNLSTGRFRRTPNGRYTFILEE